MDLTKEAISHIQNTTQDRSELLIFPGEPKNMLRVRRGDTLEKVELPNPPEDHALDRLVDLVSLAKSWNELERVIQIFCNPDRIVMVGYETNGPEKEVSNTDRPHLATLLLRPSSEFVFFRQRFTKPMIAMQELREAMQTCIAKCPADSKLLGMISHLQRVENKSLNVQVDNGKESLGLSVTDEVRSGQEQPDELQVFNVLRWANADIPIRHSIECLLCADITDGPQWYLYPYEWSLEAFEKRALDHVFEHLVGQLDDVDDVELFRGRWGEQATWNMNDFGSVEKINAITNPRTHE